MYGFVYKITIINNESDLYNKFYIGKHKCNDLSDGYICSGTIINNYLYKHFGLKRYLRKSQDYNSIGVKREILCICETKEELNNKEIFFIKEGRISKDCLNQSKGGEGVLELSQECKQKQLQNVKKTRSSKLSREKTSIRSKENWKKDEYIKLQKLHHNSELSKQKWRKATENNFKDENFRKKHSIATKEAMHRPDVKEKMYRSMHTKEYHEKTSERCKKFYENNSSLKRQIASKVSNHWKNMTEEEYNRRREAIKKGMKQKKDENK